MWGTGLDTEEETEGRPVGDPVDRDGEDASGKGDEGGEKDEAVEHQPSSSKGSGPGDRYLGVGLEVVGAVEREPRRRIGEVGEIE